ncbi:MAG: GreA/GreB family elongation factor [Gammaproteobacteria bacterium]
MGRWRERQKPGAPYITAAGYIKLETEQQALWAKRREVVKHLAAAAAEGDRSENAEYIYRKKQLRELDRRIGYLERRMPKLQIVRDHPDADRVFFGAYVELIDEHGSSYKYRIVGSDEIDHAPEHISIDAPVARALLGKRIDDEVTVALAERSVTYIVDSIAY